MYNLFHFLLLIIVNWIGSTLIDRVTHKLICRLFEGDASEITTLREAEFREQTLVETLKQVQLRKVCV